MHLVILTTLVLLAFSTTGHGYISTPPDIVVIGGGSAGLTAAKFGARFGKSVLLVEKARLGGDCTWTGCVPSKSLLAAARVAHTSRTAASFGVGSGPVTVDWNIVTGRLRKTIGTIYDEDDSPEVSSLYA